MEVQRKLNPLASPFTPISSTSPPPFLVYPRPPPPPYPHLYFVPPPPHRTSFFIYNVINHHDRLMPLLQTPQPEMLSEQPVLAPPMATVGHRAAKNGGGSRALRGERSVNGPGKGPIREGFGVRPARRRIQERRSEGPRNRKSGSWKKEVKHQVIPVRPDEAKTTVMIKNIPYGYKRRNLINFLDEYSMLENEKAKSAEENFICAYDFVYLPIDFRTKNSRGFAFVNFTDPRAVQRFFQKYHGQRFFHDKSVSIEIVCAKIQGKQCLVNHFQESVFECSNEEFLPVCFTPARDGSPKRRVKQTAIGRLGSRCGT